MGLPLFIMNTAKNLLWLHSTRILDSTRIQEARLAVSRNVTRNMLQRTGQVDSGPITAEHQGDM